MARDRGRTALSAAVEAAIGLNVDCCGAEGVYRVRDAVLAAIEPHMRLAYKRGVMAERSRAGYKALRVNNEEKKT